MTTPDGRQTLVFNGEIYNFKELRERYLAGVRLTSASDTEVLLHVLARRGSEILPELRGMFALAFWDRDTQQLLLARDPFGKKPLYYAEQSGSFWFGSEVKALLMLAPLLQQIDRRALTKYFLYEYVPAPATGWQDIQQLLPGTQATVTVEQIKIQQWWRAQYRPKNTVIDEVEALREMDGRLRMAVARRMIADVPVGLLLSGGLDSTTIGWYMRQVSTAPVHSFSASFGEKSFDESRYAHLAAKALGMQHHELTFDLDTFKAVLPEATEMMDVPFGDASLLPTYAVSKLARSEITVALDGDGSDELLGGYGTFQAAAVADRLPPVPQAATRMLASLAARLPTSYANFSWDFKLKSFVRGLSYPRARRNQVWLGSFAEQDLKQLLVPAWQGELAHLWEDVELLHQESESLDTLDAVSWLTIHHYLANDILVKLDRATMLTSLEARTPFLDIDLAEFLMRLPSRLKRNKYILRRLMRGRVPDAIIDRPKRGFGVPIGFWLRGPLYGWAREILAADKLQQQGVLQPATVNRLLKEHRAGKADHRKKLWTLLAWQLWYDRWAL